MRGAYQSVPLGTVCKVLNGRAYSKSELLAEGPTPVLRVGNFFTNQNWYYSDLILGRDKYCDDGDLLYAWSASFGPRIWDGGRAIYHYHIWKMVPDDAKLDKRYAYYFLDWDKELIRAAHGAGATMIHVTKGSMEARLIPLPPLEEQRRIVAVLDESFAAVAAAIANAEKNLSNARELFESELRTAFAQEAEVRSARRLGDVLKTSAGGTPLSKKKDFYEGGTIPWLLSGEVGQREITSASRYITEAGLQASSAKYFPINSVLVAMYGATAGEVGILRFRSTSNQAVCAIHPDEAYLPEYLYYFVRSQYEALVAQAVGNAQPNISQAKIREMSLPLASIDDQKAVAARLNAAWEASEALTALQGRKKALLDGLKQSLLHRAFSGELTEREALAA